MILIDKYFAVYRKRRRKLISREAPSGLTGDRPPQARTWQAHQHRMNKEPVWERAERYRRMMQEQGSQIARILKVLELPEHVLAALRAHAGHARIRAYFTERRLRQLVRENRGETAILHEIEQVVQGHA